jgi:3-oxoadipate enol-lactonase
LCTFPEPARAALRDRARVARVEGMARVAQLANERWFTSDFRARRPDMLDRATKSLMLQDADFHASMWEMIAGLDLEAALPAIACPTLVVAGAEDINAPIAAAKKIAGLIPGAALHVMAGLGHFPPFETPTPFNARLRRFLTGDASRATARQFAAPADQAAS